MEQMDIRAPDMMYREGPISDVVFLSKKVYLNLITKEKSDKIRIESILQKKEKCQCHEKSNTWGVEPRWQHR